MNLRRRAAVVLLLTGLSAGLPVFGAGGGLATAGTFPGANGKLIFDIGCLPPCEVGIATVSPDGQDRATVVSNSDIPGRSPVLPDASPDGSQIVFMAGDGSTRSAELYIADADGSNIRQVTSNAVADRWPSWTAAGRALVYERGDHIWKIASDGTDAQRLNKKVGSEPAVSPDGRWITFEGEVRAREGLSYGQIFKMRIDGSHLTRLTASSRISSQPSWSPDGRHIVFLKGRAGSVVVMRADGTREREILHREGAVSPVFSPAGTRVAYVHEARVIKIVARDGTGMRTVENSDGASFRVAWAVAQ